MPLPAFCGKIISRTIVSIINFLQPLVLTNVWLHLKSVSYSILFRFILEALAFFGGFPPEQPAYFHEYMRDVFAYRSQTIGLLNLILSLDAAPMKGAESLSHPSVIVSSYFDFVTGVYLSVELSKKMKNAKHVVFSMGSHFLLLEWPEMVAREIVEFIKIDRS